MEIVHIKMIVEMTIINKEIIKIIIEVEMKIVNKEINTITSKTIDKKGFLIRNNIIKGILVLKEKPQIFVIIIIVEMIMTS